jgi:hypothetical protein
MRAAANKPLNLIGSVDKPPNPGFPAPHAADKKFKSRLVVPASKAETGSVGGACPRFRLHELLT